MPGIYFLIDLRHIDAWVFDLDNTLYDAECQLFAQIDERMTAFIQDRLGLPHMQARKLQKDYYVQYGTTMSGLMREHDVEPQQFLDYVHDIDLTVIKPNPSLAAALADLPGEKYIYTNGSTRHAENVAGALEILHLFDDVYDIKAAQYRPKPDRAPYETFLRQFDLKPGSAVMFEDIAQNLEPPHALGMTTVLVCSDAAWLADEPEEKRPARTGDGGEHIHYQTNDLTAFLKAATTSQSLA
ncbi:MAG: pyrimidine 5'-nucleotidase [Alphaproteobacteria bacterium]|nr:pyrimidine 5'-nucleotidase [Alphaproteobacteria bacterium]